MKIIEPSYEILTPIVDGIGILKAIEFIGRTCYKSTELTTETSAVKFVSGLIKRGHEAMLEFNNLSVRFVADRAWTHEIVRMRLCSFAQECLSGDTEVRSFQPKTGYPSKRWTIKQLYDWQSSPVRACKIKQIRLRSVDSNGRIVPNKIKSVLQNGEKDVYKVTTKTGRSIKSTMNHLYYTPDGYKPLSDLKVGSRVYANGLSCLDNEEFLRENYLKKNMQRKDLANLIGCCESVLGKAFRRFGIVKPKSQYPNRQPGHGRKGQFSEETLLQLSESKKKNKNPQWKGDNITKSGGYTRSNKYYERGECWGCGVTTKIERHHVDKNPRNNHPDNCIDLCQKCHKAFHHKDIRSVYSDEIAKIEYVGREMTYDLEMVSEPHNFVANGLVVHNSQRYCAYDKDKFGNELTFIKPIGIEEGSDAWKIWKSSCEQAEKAYLELRELEIPPEIARDVLPNSCKTEIVVGANLRQWRHVLKLRAQGTTGTPHPAMRELMIPLLKELQQRIPVVFEDIVPYE